MMDGEGSTATILQQSSSRRKRKFHQVSHSKKLRSRIPRRKRLQISPILGGSLNSLFSDDESEVSAFPAGSSSSSCFPDEISCASNWLSVGSENLTKKSRTSSLKKKNANIRGFGAGINADVRNSRSSGETSREECRRITRLYLRQKENERAVEKKGNRDFGVELSESSCVESFSGVEVGELYKSDVLSVISSKDRQREVVEQLEESEGTAASAAVSLSEGSYVPQENDRNVCEFGKVAEKTNMQGMENVTEPQQYEVSDISVVESLSEAKFQTICQPTDEISEKAKTAPESSMSENSRNYEPDVAVKNSESIAAHKPGDFDLDYSVACSECLSYEEDSEYSTGHEMTLSEFESDIFSHSFDMESLDFSPLLTGSPSDFSEKSAENSVPPVYFPLFLQYTKQFCRMSSPLDIGAFGQDHDKYLDEFSPLRFEDEEHEESYKNFRSRERKVNVHDYAEVYYSRTECGDLILQQRLHMVNWIVEQSKERELHGETIFLAVSLFDRFLSQGSFKSKRKLQVLGIACLTLATRIEENQPFNCKSEVIAMEEGPHFPIFLAHYIQLLMTHVRTKNDDLSECIKSLEWLVKYVC